MKSFYISVILLFFSCPSFSQENVTSDIKDSIDFLKVKRTCNISEYKNEADGFHFKTTGKFIKAYSITSPDNMMTYTIAMSTLDTVWTLDLKAFGNIWASNPIGIEALGGVGESSISIPDFPIKVEFDKQNKKYIYSAHLVSRKPFKTVDEQKIASNIFDIFTCSVYKLYVFEHVIKNPEFMRDCFMQMNNQIISKVDRDRLKKESKKWHDELAPLIKQAQEEYDKKQKSNKKKKKS